MDKRNSGDEIVIPVVAEQLETGVRKVNKGGVRVRKTVHERDELVDLPLAREDVEVRRVVKNEVVDGPLPVRSEGDTVIVPVVKQVAKVVREWVLTEELHVSTRRTEEHRSANVTLEQEEVTVERIDASGNAIGQAEVKEGAQPESG
jgi:uncharacterized protein (TIGR02271 family)